MIVPAGRINKLFGTEGGVMLSLYADFPEDFDDRHPAAASPSTRSRCRSGASVSNAAASLGRRGDIRRLRHRAPGAGACSASNSASECDEEDDDEFYLEDLIGFAVTGFEIRHGGTKTSSNSKDSN